MHQSEKAAEKMLFLLDRFLKYKSRYIKDNHILYRKEGISERQIKILVILFISGKNTISQMEEIMNTGKSTLSIVLSKLCKKGFVIREMPRDDDDKRKSYFKITDCGICKLKELGDITIEHFKKIYSSFSEERKKAAAVGINQLSVSIRESKNNFYNKIIQSSYYRDYKADGEVSELAFKFYIFFMCFAEYYDSILKKNIPMKKLFGELGKNRFYILYCIKNYDLDTISKLEKYTNLSGSTISITISRLVKGGFLYKEYPNGNGDGRRVFIRLTQKGCDSMKNAKENIFNSFKMYFQEFSKKENENIIDAIDYLIKAFQ